VRTIVAGCQLLVVAGFIFKRRAPLPPHGVVYVARSTAMCHNVHMKTISIRELHLQTGRWVRHAASRGPIVVTDRGRRVAALEPYDASATRRPLPNREAAIRKRSRVPVDSVVYQSELREDR
jgi:antitoxin (DNA-binding transcriptional repressor) of toxin-antitoxin stability system